MNTENSDAYAVYVARLNTTIELMGWGLFLFMATMPLPLLAMYELHFICFPAYLASLFGAFGIFGILIRWSNRAGIGLWIDPNKLNPFGVVERLALFGFSGIIAMSLLFSLSFYWSGIYRHNAPLSETWETILLSVIIGIAAILTLPIVHIVVGIIKKRQKEERVRRRTVRIKKQDLEGRVFKALGSLGLSQTEVEEGSKWVGPIPSYKVEGRDISLRIFQGGGGSSTVFTITRAPEDYGKAEEIERRIDSLISTET
ncbi:MAG: hypothetical protein V3U51_06070 [Thermoplasmata archaeon]